MHLRSFWSNGNNAFQNLRVKLNATPDFPFASGKLRKSQAERLSIAFLLETMFQMLRTILLRQGRIVADGPTRDVVRLYAEEALMAEPTLAAVATKRTTL